MVKLLKYFSLAVGLTSTLLVLAELITFARGIRIIIYEPNLALCVFEIVLASIGTVGLIYIIKETIYE